MVRKLVQGVGINDVYDDNFGYVMPKYYNIWQSVLQRCYSPKIHQRRSTYINCSVSKEWIYLSNFREWFNKNYVDGYQLDKDLLFPGNKVYGSDTCVFVPRNINQLFVFCNSIRGEYPLGVCYVKTLNYYKSGCRNGNKKITTKCFKDPIEAHFWYLDQKINIINQYLQEDHSDKIKTGLNRWKQLLTYHIDNQIIFDPDNIQMHQYYS